MFKRLASSTFARGIGTLAGGTIIAQAVVVIAAPILTRLYSPSNFGDLAVFTSIVSVLGGIACLRFNAAIPLAENDRVAAALLTISIGITVAFTAITSLLLWIWGDELLHLLNSATLLSYVWAVPVAVGFIGIYSAFYGWATRERLYSLMAKTKLSQGIASVVIQLSLGLMGVSTLGLLAGQVVGNSAGIGRLLRDAWQPTLRALRHVTPAMLGASVKRFRQFPLYSTWGTLLSRASTVAPPVVLAMIYGTEVAGWYAIGDRILKTPLYLLGRAVAQVFLGESATLIREDPTKVRRLFLSTARTLALLGIAPLIGVLLFGPAVFNAVLGPEWIEAGRIVQILAISYFAQFIINPLVNTFTLLGQQRLQAVCDLAHMVALGVMFTVVGHMALDYKVALTLYALVEGAYYGGLYILSLARLNHYTNTHTVT